MTEQIFAYAKPENAEGTNFSWTEVYVCNDGTIVVGVCGPSGRYTEIGLPPEKAAEMCAAINTAVFPHLPGSRK